MKPIMITLMYLTFGGDIKLDTFEIQTDCSGWFHHNVKVVEKKKRKLFSTPVKFLFLLINLNKISDDQNVNKQCNVYRKEWQQKEKQVQKWI